jgi:hypothetical protein
MHFSWSLLSTHAPKREPPKRGEQAHEQRPPPKFLSGVLSVAVDVGPSAARVAITTAIGVTCRVVLLCTIERKQIRRGSNEQVCRRNCGQGLARFFMIQAWPRKVGAHLLASVRGVVVWSCASVSEQKTLSVDSAISIT